MPSNYVLLRKTTLTASAASVTLSSIPQTGYTDLKLIVSARGDGASGSYNDWIKISFNSSTTSFTFRELEGDGATPGSYTGSSPFVVSATTSGQTANVFSNAEVYIPNYAGSNQKSYSGDSVTESNASLAQATINSGLWANTAAINSITLTLNSSTNFVAKSEFSLYGIAAVGVTPEIAPFATGGDIVTTDGTYWYHAFLSSGVFKPSKNLTCDYLVVAGGGGGSGDRAGGGGAGGLRSTVTATGGGGSLESPIGVTSQNYLITIGAGGAGIAGQSLSGYKGSDSTFSSITSTGGGLGGTWTTIGGNGGSGGGGGGSASGGSYAGGSGTTNQGRAGGAGFQGSEPTTYGTAGGGGGASVAGSNGLVSGAGAGGAGVTITALATPTGTGVSGVYAGGGGGGIDSGNSNSAGAGGAGGGGAGGKTTVATSGTANTGGGGGGGGFNRGSVTWAGSGSGGSGIVIIRYPVA